MPPASFTANQNTSINQGREDGKLRRVRTAGLSLAESIKSRISLRDCESRKI